MKGAAEMGGRTGDRKRSGADISISRSWLAVASAEHVALGRAQGFMQVCHGKCAPLRRLHAGDRVVTYSPTRNFGGKDRLQAFTALGVVAEGEPFAFDMGGGFVPYRRCVNWLPATEQAIGPLLDRLQFTAGVRNWGYQLRFGLLTISEPDMDLISAVMAPVTSASCRADRASAAPRLWA